MAVVGIYESPAGVLRVTTDKGRVVSVDFCGNEARMKSGSRALDRKCRRQLDGYFTGRRRAFNLPLRFSGTVFQRKVWRALTRIPYGATRSYREMAEAVGNKRAVRAVAGAIAKNKILVVVPCHRVIRSDGRPAGYAAGARRKRWLLFHERTRVL